MNIRDVPKNAPICASGKRPFETEERALGQLSKAKGRRDSRDGYKPGRVETRAYHCPACNWWHLTAKARGY